MRSEPNRFRRTALTVLLTATLGGAGVIAPADARTSAAEAPDIPVENVVGHLGELQAIAEANGGNRSTGQPGYEASLNYVKGKLDAAGFTTAVQEFETSSGTSYNLIADWEGGDTANTVMVGGHLDSVDEGAGINDNGTGSAAILETALTFAASNPQPVNHVRFAWWGAEELGLLGSTHYVESLTAAAADEIAAYFNFDMIGSPNPGYFVYDDDPNGTALRDSLTAWFEAAGTPTEYVDVDGRSDHAAFMQAGIPTAGTFTGAEETMTAEQAEKWGGEANQAFDECYHASCDDSGNIDQAALDVNTDAIAGMVWEWSAHDFGAGVLQPAA